MVVPVPQEGGGSAALSFNAPFYAAFCPPSLLCGANDISHAKRDDREALVGWLAPFGRALLIAATP